ncbi:MAG: TrkH family potassium uptake protein, partial [Oscillospiraceae bacterium]
MNTNKKTVSNLQIISYYSGIIICGTACLMLIPILFTILFKEWNPMFDFIISMCISLLIGLILMTL